jgi:Ca2+-binding RTX toxin-like protein
MSYSISKEGVRQPLDVSRDQSLTYVSNSQGDVIAAGSFNDVLRGNGGHDKLWGGGGNDDLSGGLGNDRLMGEAGNDMIAGGAGKDVLFGGAGRDAFIFASALNARTNVDTIRDFRGSEGDRIMLDYKVFLGLKDIPAPDDHAIFDLTLNRTNFRVGKAAADADDRIVYDRQTGKIYYDADGTGSMAAVLFANVNPGTVVKYQYFYSEGGHL